MSDRASKAIEEFLKKIDAVVANANDNADITMQKLSVVVEDANENMDKALQLLETKLEELQSRNNSGQE